ncbi:FAD-dependent oxidoreductase, partial [Frankia sp. Cpl3]|nr:FAD-dependent oxidoreductase [Frankia sp. Cpl3]
RDRISGNHYEIAARKVVNATGPWVDQLRKKDGSLNQKRLHLTKGVHLVVSRSRFPLTNSVYFDSPDGRMIFAIPRENTAYIGTTDTDYSGEIGDPRTLPADRDYLLRAVNAMFPKARLRPGDVISSWAGLRPLIHQEGKGASELSRKDELFLSHTGLITIVGGKLTGYRKMAEKVVDLVTKQLGKELGITYPRCKTDRLVLSGGEVPSGKSFAEVQAERISLGASKGIPEDVCKHLVDLYGANAEAVYARIERCSHQGKT